MRKSLSFLSIISSFVFNTTSYADNYFLTAQQKKELILSGQMHDQEQRLYDVWIVTGYVQPIHHVQQGWQKAGKTLTDYTKPSFYHDIGDDAQDTWHYGTKSILKNYALNGTKKAWQQDMQTAKKRTQQRVFGWWLAYPWGVFEASVESALRLGSGIPIGLGVTAAAYTVVPTFGLVWPSIKSVGYATIEGTAYPVVAASWNTLIAPPLALLGQQPAPERADGFWMKQVDDPSLDAFVEVFKQWQQNIAGKPEKNEIIQQYEQQIVQLQKQISNLQTLKQQAEQQSQEAYTSQLILQVQQQKPQLEASLAAKNLSLAILARNRQALQSKLEASTWSYSQLQQVLDSLLTSNNQDNKLERATDDKTDPLQRSLDLIKHH